MISEGWLKSRLAESPTPLRDGLRRSLAELDTGTELSQALLGAACGVLESARDRLQRREAAFDLLVADGLLTLACEAAAYSDPQALVDTCRAMGPGGALGHVAERWAARS